jgi:hypothetical protein
MENVSDAVAPELLAAKLLSRALHDIAGPASGLTAALDLLGDAENGALHTDALALARDSLAQIAARIAFCRAAFGGGGTLDGEAFTALMQTPFAGSRARLELGAVAPGGPAVVLQGTLILLQISAEALAAGGAARLSLEPIKGVWRARVEGEGRRIRLAPEAVAGLRGRGLGPGLSGRWAPARYLQALAQSLGGALDVSADEVRFRLDFTCPSQRAAKNATA